ncbi:MAG: hypothetical protein K2K19_13275 [Acetatifactor sp.]|nr:hypothetical protein [Acetatifactor sp.]
MWIYDLNTGDGEKVQVGENQKIHCWDVENGKVYYSVKTQKTDTDIVNEIVIRDLEKGKEEVITLEEQIERIHRMSVNSKEEIGIFYWNVDSAEDHLGLIRDGQCTEIDTSNVEIWELGRNELHEFQLLDDKFMMCTEDIGHTLTPWNRSYEIFFDGSWKDIPCEQNAKNILGYVDDFYYVGDYYIVYWSPWTMSGGFGADTIQNAKVLLCTLDGKCYREIDIPESNQLQTSVYFMSSDEAVYVISVSGEEHRMCVQEEYLDECQPKESVGLASTDWFVYAGEFYVKTGEDTYEKGDFPDEIQHVLQEQESTHFVLKKEENKLILESESDFFIYDFASDCIVGHKTEYGHLGWQVCKDQIYYIANVDNGQTRLMVYDMASGSINEIDTGEYMPVQFHVRRDGAIGMWGKNAEGDQEYCFWEGSSTVYVPDKDEYLGWTYLCSFTERGIILEREYPVSSLQGTKIYGITETGEISVLAGISDWDNLKAIPEGSLVFAEDKIIAVDLSSGLAKAYDSEFCYSGELQWDIDIDKEMEFVGFYTQEDDIWGIWQLEDERLFRLGLLIQNDFKEDKNFNSIDNFNSQSTEQQEKVRNLVGEWQIDRVVLESNMYSGTSLDGDFEENIFDPEDFVGYTLRYSEDSFSLGDVEYANPCYLVSEITVGEYNEGGGFRNPDLFTLIAEEEIEVEGAANTPNLSQAKLMRVDVTFDHETNYSDYSFIPVGTQMVLLDYNTMLIGVWGKILLAYRI